jgi:hypothetical protein
MIKTSNPHRKKTYLITIMKKLSVILWLRLLLALKNTKSIKKRVLNLLKVWKKKNSLKIKHLPITMRSLKTINNKNIGCLVSQNFK